MTKRDDILQLIKRRHPHAVRPLLPGERQTVVDADIRWLIDELDAVRAVRDAQDVVLRKLCPDAARLTDYIMGSFESADETMSGVCRHVRQTPISLYAAHCDEPGCGATICEPQFQCTHHKGESRCTKIAEHEGEHTANPPTCLHAVTVRVIFENKIRTACADCGWKKPRS